MRSSEDARELETLAKQAEQDGLGYCRQFIVSDYDTKANSDESLTHTALVTASTTEVDRDQEVVDVSGLGLRMFRKNPVIAWSHNTDIPPIGRSVWEKKDGESLKSLVKLADRPTDWQGKWFPDEVFALIDQKILRGVSIGFISLEAGPPSDKEVSFRPYLSMAKRLIRKAMLLEISIVPIGANQSALVESVQKGLLPSDVVDHFGLELPSDDLWIWDTKSCLAETKESKPTRLDLLRKLHR